MRFAVLALAALCLAGCKSTEERVAAMKDAPLVVLTPELRQRIATSVFTMNQRTLAKKYPSEGLQAKLTVKYARITAPKRVDAMFESSAPRYGLCVLIERTMYVLANFDAAYFVEFINVANAGAAGKIDFRVTYKEDKYSTTRACGLDSTTMPFTELETLARAGDQMHAAAAAPPPPQPQTPAPVAPAAEPAAE